MSNSCNLLDTPAYHPTFSKLRAIIRSPLLVYHKRHDRKDIRSPTFTPFQCPTTHPTSSPKSSDQAPRNPPRLLLLLQHQIKWHRRSLLSSTPCTGTSPHVRNPMFSSS